MGMNMLEQLLGGGQQQEYQEFVNRYDQGAPWQGISDREAYDRFQQVAPQLPPDMYQQSAQQVTPPLLAARRRPMSWKARRERERSPADRYFGGLTAERKSALFAKRHATGRRDYEITLAVAGRSGAPGPRAPTATSWPTRSSRAATWGWRWAQPRGRRTGGGRSRGGWSRRRPAKPCGGSDGASGYSSRGGTTWSAQAAASSCRAAWP